MAHTSKYTGTQIDNLLDGRYHNFIQSIQDTLHTVGSPQVITADTPVKYTNNGGIPVKVIAPDYITSRWDTTNNKIAFPEEMNTPVYVGEVGFTFDPSVAAEGTATIKVYIDDDTPKLIKTYKT